MPRISEFYGIVITMYWTDHEPPHFHAYYGEYDAQVLIATGEVMGGELPRRALRLVKEWTELHRAELMENWQRLDVRVALTGGAVFDYASGRLRRGPRFLRDNGFEWLARLLAEPRRLWRRYLVGNPLFLLRVLRQRLGRVG